jgi:hypothetical protein
VSQTDIVKEITTCTSFDLGKASFHKELFGPLLGDGILTSNGTTWARHRNLLAPEFYMDKVKVNNNITMMFNCILTPKYRDYAILVSNFFLAILTVSVFLIIYLVFSLPVSFIF